MSRLMEVMEGERQKLVIAAYDSPRFEVEKNQVRAVEDFENEAYLVCIRSER